jgi:peptidoglycan/LPS O-acetylase OafA/YrhL
MAALEAPEAGILSTPERRVSTGVDSLGGKSRNLDLLRSFAVLEVLFDHSFRLFGIATFGIVGRSGVLLFFIHTALVLMLSLERRRNTAWQFYIQRFFRIYPLCLATIAACLVFRIPAQPLMGDPSFHWHGWAWVASNALLIQNLVGTPSMSAPLWSLPFEVQMYLSLPFAYVLTKSRRPLTKIVALSIVAALSTFALAALFRSPLTEIILWPAPCFLSGVMAFVLFRRAPRILPVGLLIALIVVFTMANMWRFKADTYWISCSVVGLTLPLFKELRNPFAAAVFNRIAKYSYGIYLGHILLMWLCFRAIPGAVALPIRCGLFVCLLIAVPIVAYRLIEEPMIRHGRKIARQFT